MQENDWMCVEQFLEGCYYCPSGVIITPNLPNGKDVTILEISYNVMKKLLGEPKSETFSDVVGQFIVDAIIDKIAKEKISRNKIDIQVT
jgi:hypothetical protein